MGLFKQKKSKFWWMSLRVNGKRVKISTKVTNKQLAEKIYAKQLLDIEEGRWFSNEAKKRTFEELKERYMRDHSRIRKSPTSLQRDEYSFKRLSEFFGGLTLADITSGILSDYDSKRILEKANPATVAKELSTLRNALNLAIKWEWLEESPFRKFKIQSANNKRERILTPEEEEKLFKASPAWLREIIVFALNTGMRQSEALTLQWPQVDLERKTATLLITKNKERRTVPLNPTVIELLSVKIKMRRNSVYVFQSEAGTQIIARNLIRAFIVARNKANLEDFRWHDFRHSAASRMVQRGVDLYTVSKILGHKDLRMTMRYSHHTVESLRHGVDVLGHTLVIPEDQKAGADRVSA